MTDVHTRAVPRRWFLVPLTLWAGVAVLTAAAVVLHPSVAERTLSSDGQLAEGTRRLLLFAQAIVLAMASVLAIGAWRLRHYTAARLRFVAGAAFCLLALAGSVVLCEAGLRAAAGFRPLPADRHFFFEHDDVLGWRHRPGAVATFKNAVVRINSAGLRDDEVDERRRDGERRVLVLGDSQVFGDGVAAGDTFPQLLEREVRGLQAINAGVIGYGTDQELLYFERHGQRFHADAVVVGLNAYDLRDNISTRVRSGYVKPRFTIRDAELQLANVPIPAGTITDRAQRFLRSRSQLYTQLGRLIESPAEAREGRRSETATQVFPSDDAMAESLAITRAILVRLAASAKAARAALVVVFLPYEMDFSSDRRYREQSDRLVQTLATTAQQAGFFAVDLRASLTTGSALYLDTMHFNPLGHQQVAAALKTVLQTHDLLDKPHVN